jgi:two-component system, cell cycle sensor histidine kinase and response regulator CckA
MTIKTKKENQLEQALIKSEQKYRNLYDNALVGLYQTRIEGGEVIAANKTVAKIFGYDSVEQFKSEFKASEHYANPDERKKMVKLSNEKDRIENVEITGTRKDGSIVPLEMSSVVYPEEGIFEGVIIDVSAKKDAQKALRKSEEKYRLVVENANEAITVAQDGKLKFFNSRMIEMVGYSREEISSMQFNSFIHPEDRKMVDERHQRRLEGENIVNNYEFRVNKKNGDIIWVEINVVRIEWNNKPATLNFLTEITKRKNSEKALKDSERRFRTVSQLTSDYAYSYQVNPDFTMELEWVTGALVKITGFNHDKIKERGGWESIIYPDDLSIPRTQLKELLAGNISVVEYRVVSKNGNLKWMRDYAQPEFADNGKQIVRILGAVQDITINKDAEEVIRESEEKYRLLVENQTDLIIKVDKDGRFVFASDSFCKLFGKHNNELIDHVFNPEVHPEDLERTWKVLDSLKETPHISYIENRMMTIDGWRWIAWVNKAFFNEENEIVEILGAGRDINERKQAEEALNESRKMLRLVLDTIPVRVFWKNRKSEYLGCNQLFAEDAGLTKTDEIINKTDFDLSWKKQAELYRKNDLEVMNSGIPKLNLEGPQTGPDGKHIWLKASKVPLRDKENKIVGILGSYEDITEKKSLEEQFRQAQKMEAVGRLAGGIAHDFNNLLTAIKGYSQLLLSDLDKELPQYEDIEEINKAANRAAQLTHQLLTFSRKQVIQPQIIDVNDSIANMKKMLFRLIGEDIMLVTSLNASNSIIKIDLSQIEQIIMNLSVNARDAMPKGGKLTIETKNIILSNRREGMEPGIYLQLSVIDTGVGISEEVKQHLFEPFYTTKEIGKGTGLGLATVYGIVNQNAGKVNVISEKNQGTTFEILFPLHEGKVETFQQNSFNEASYSGVETVLIVEDEAIVCDLAVRVLEKFGYDVMAAKKVDDAIKLVTNCERTIHLLVSDVVMPKMNGADLASHLNKILPDMKVLFISGYTDETIIHHGVLDGEVNFLQKPFTPEQLIKKVRQILDEKAEII